jgi:hypothetical protein
VTEKQNIEMNAIAGAEPIVKKLSKGFMLVILKVSTHELIDAGCSPKLSVTVWHTLRLWNRMSLFVALHIKKGDRIKIDGVVTYRCDGNDKRTIAEIKAESITLLTINQ